MAPESVWPSSIYRGNSCIPWFFLRKLPISIFLMCKKMAKRQVYLGRCTLEDWVLNFHFPIETKHHDEMLISEMPPRLHARMMGLELDVIKYVALWTLWNNTLWLNRNYCPQVMKCRAQRTLTSTENGKKSNKDIPNNSIMCCISFLVGSAQIVIRKSFLFLKSHADASHWSFDPVLFPPFPSSFVGLAKIEFSRLNSSIESNPMFVKYVSAYCAISSGVRLIFWSYGWVSIGFNKLKSASQSCDSKLP